MSDSPSATPRIEHIPPDGGQHLAVHFETQTVKVGTEQSAGELLFMATTTAPGKGTPLHTHPVHEYFYILDGTYEFHALHEGGRRHSAQQMARWSTCRPTYRTSIQT